MKKKKYIIFALCAFIYIFFLAGQDRVPIEELDIINGLGYDIRGEGNKIFDYLISYSAYVYKPAAGRINTVYEGEALNIGEVHQEKQKRVNKKIIQGQERAVVISDEYANYGVSGLIDERFRNPEYNDMAYVVVCKGKAKDYLKYKQIGYINSSEFIYGLLDNAYNYNFFSKDYKIVDMYVRIDAEGRNIVLPFINMKEEGLKLDGCCVFKKDRLAAIVDMNDTRILNLLRNENVRGDMTIQESPSHYIDTYVESKGRKVECYKKDDKYVFVIDLDLIGKIVSNELYKDISKDINVKKKFEKDMEKEITAMCSDFIKKMQQQYKVDALELGRVGAAQFGRRTNVDWNEIVIKADIKVNAKFHITGFGRGDY